MKRQRTYDSDAQMQKANRETLEKSRKIAGRELKKKEGTKLKKEGCSIKKRVHYFICSYVKCVFLHVCVASTYGRESLRFYFLFRFSPSSQPKDQAKYLLIMIVQILNPHFAIAPCLSVLIAQIFFPRKW